jgi:N-acetylneuraminic acid mutarotase
LGTAAATNIPGGRSGAIGWTGVDGTLWLFGGIGNDSKGSLGSLNDLWEFDPSTKEWAWMSGSSTVGSGGGQAGVYGSFGNPSPSVVPSGRTQAVSWVDSSGDLWLFGGKGYDSTGTLGYLNDLWEFNPSTRQWAWMGGSNTVGCTECGMAGIYGTLGKADSVNSPGGRSQAVGWIDSNGNLWLFGGNGFDSNGTQGSLNDLWEFIPSTLEWAWMGGGNTVPAPKEGQPGVYGVAGVPAAGNTPGSRSATGGWTDGDGNLWLFGGTGFDSSGTDGNLNDLWVYQPSSGNLPAAMPTLSLAPGTYSGTQTVTITDATPGAIIYFTTNGVTPTTSSSRYSGPITVSSTTTIEAIALATGYKASAEASATYTFASSFSIAPLAGAATNVTVQPGSVANFSLVATPIGSSTFPAAISLTASGLPAGATATFTPNGIAAGLGTTNISLSIQTSSASAAIVPGKSNWPVVLCLLFLPLAGIRRWRSCGDQLQMSRRFLAGICLIAGITIAISGCSGSVAQNNSGSGSGTSKPTPYNITVTAASGSVHQTTTVTVTVQ